MAAWAPLMVLVLLCVIVAAINRNFLSPGNFVRMSQDAAIPLVLGLGETFIILMGSIDLSVEGILTLSAVVLSMTVLNGMNDNNFGILAVILVLVIGALVGFANGFVHVRLKVPSFMATLGSWFIGVGVANALLGGMATRINDPWIRGLAIQRVFGLPWGVWLALACLGVALVVQNYTRLGRHIYALGGGEELAALSGISAGARPHRNFHARRGILRGWRHTGGGATGPWQCADRQRSPVHDRDRGGRRRNIAIGRSGRRPADLCWSADCLGIVERHGADGRAAERTDRFSRTHDYRRGRPVD